MTKPSALNGRLTKWAMLLSRYDMQFLLQKAIKGQVIADFLAENPGSDMTKLYEDLPEETAKVHSVHALLQMWELNFNGAFRTSLQVIPVAGVGVVPASSEDHVIPRAFSLTQGCTN